MARTRMVIGLLLAIAGATWTQAARAAPQSADADGPQWPNVPLPALGTDNSRLRPLPGSFEARWPKLPGDNTIVPAAPVRAVDPETTQSTPSRAATNRWSASEPAPFSLEGGARYWFSTGSMNFGFTNGNPLYGIPTSTLDWSGLTGHTGEVFARLDHRPTGLFVKGLAGMGSVVDGNIIDRDFFADQVKFSDTSSDVRGNDINYAVIDLGWAYEPPQGGQRWGLFAGYQYWREKVTAYGLRCNADDVSGALCGPPGAVPVNFDTAVLMYEPRWHALRLGVDWKMDIAEKWTFSGEAAWIPYAVLRNEDSHLLRQDSSDLGPAPNVITKSSQGYGAAADLFLNYAITPNIEFGAGLRYWGLFTDRGTVQFGPSFTNDTELMRFEQQRYGVLLQIKGRI